MNETPDNTDPRLEELLRQWGADEAGAAAREHLAPKTAPGPSWQTVALRWAPAAAAAVLFLAAGTLFLTWHIHGASPADGEAGAEAQLQAPSMPAAPTAADLQDDIRKLATENAKLKMERDDLKESLLRADGQRVAVLSGHKAELDKLTAQITEQKVTIATAVDAARKAQLAAEARQTELTAATAARDKALADLKASGQEVKRWKDTVADLTRREAKLKAEYATAAAAMADANEKVSTELAAARKQNELMRERFGKLYLAVGAPGQTGLAARKTTARRMRLAQRGAALRRKCDNDEIKDLLDRLDVALTRLEMLDPADAPAVARFKALVSKAALEARMDRVLAAGPTQPGLAEWLRETRMILAGVDHVS